MAAVSADGGTVCVLIRRLNSSCNRSIAFEVRIDFHWLCGSRPPHRGAFQAPFSDEGFALRLDLVLRGRIDHIPVIGGKFLVQPVWRMGKKIAMLVNRAALDQNLRPQRGERLLEAGSAIGDNELRRPQAAFDEGIEDVQPGGLTLSAHVLEREENLLAVPPHADGYE